MKLFIQILSMDIIMSLVITSCIIFAIGEYTFNLGIALFSYWMGSLSLISAILYKTYKDDIEKLK